MSDHPRDPHHRVEVQPGDREVRVDFAGETIALSRRAVLLFDAVWAYLQPIPECADIAGYFCFYPDKVVLTVEGETDRASRS